MGLITLVYVSAARAMMSDDDLKAILETARRKNPPRGITGMLLYHHGYFIQALEGEEAEVERTYDEIIRDPRHFNCLVVHKSAITERSFSRWAMGFNHLEAVDPDAPAEVIEFMAHPFEPSHLSSKPSIAIHLLENFRDENSF